MRYASHVPRSVFLVFLAVVTAVSNSAGGAERQEEMLKVVYGASRPLEHERGDRLPLYVWACHDIVTGNEADMKHTLRRLADRGIAVISSWEKGKRQEEALARALRVGKLQAELGLRVNVSAHHVMGRFFNGDERTAHITQDDERFFDRSFRNAKMGCPFAADFRYDDIREQIDDYVQAYENEGVPLHFVFADWEIDGPLEWNEAWAHSKRCRRCQQNIPDLDDFLAFQAAIRKKRSEMQREVYAKTILSRFPNALVGNYGVYPHDGYRYWIDYYEDKDVPDYVPCKREQDAEYRPWYHEFPLTGYTFAMPTVYTWSWCYRWYNYDNTDFRWFYNMLLTASNACENTSSEIPIISFVHHSRIFHPHEPDESVKQFSTEKYQELLWHMLLRGTDGLFIWSPAADTARELQPVHDVYAASLRYRQFLDDGVPVTFHVPATPGPVVSGLRLDDRLLVRRTDFTETGKPVTLKIDGLRISVPPAKGCQIIELKD